MNRSIFSRSFAACKTVLTIAAFLVLSTIAIGQVNVAVAPLKMNVLYIGVDNPVSIAASASPDDKVTVSVTGGGGIISKLDAGLYNIRVSALTDDCVVNIYADGKLVGTSKFRVRRLPEPSGTIGGFTSGAYITTSFLQSQTGVGLYLKDSPFEQKFEISGFKLVLADNKGNIKSIECQGALFSSDAKKNIEQYVKAGDIVTIENIRAKNPEGKEFKIPSLLFNIKE